MKKLVFAALLLALAPATALGASNRIIFNGGITLEERETAPAEGTRLAFFVTSGSYLANIEVSVTNDAGTEVVNTTTEGPWLILDLNPGRYQVTAARSNGQVQSLAIDVTDSPQEFGFAFPEQD